MLDFCIEMLFDLVSCRFDREIWGEHVWRSLGLGVLLLVSTVVMALGLRAGSWFWSILGIAATGWYFLRTLRYWIWWVWEGRYGAAPEKDPGILEHLLIPEGDIMTGLSQEEELRGKLEDSHSCLDKRM